MQAGDHIHALLGSGRQSGVFAVGAVAQEDVALFKLVPQSSQQAQVMVMEAAQNDVEDGPAGQGEERHKLHNGKSAARFLRRGLGVAFLVFAGVGQLGGGAVHHLDGAALELAAAAGPPIGGLGGGGQGFFQALLGQSLPGLDIGRVALINESPARQPKQGLNLAHDFAAGGLGFEYLPKEAFAGQAQRENALATIGAVVLRAEQRSGDQVAAVFLELAQRGLADGLGGPAAQGGQAGTPGGEIRCVHKAVYIPPY